MGPGYLRNLPLSGYKGPLGGTFYGSCLLKIASDGTWEVGLLNALWNIISPEVILAPILLAIKISLKTGYLQQA